MLKPCGSIKVVSLIIIIFSNSIALLNRYVDSLNIKSSPTQLNEIRSSVPDRMYLLYLQMLEIQSRFIMEWLQNQYSIANERETRIFNNHNWSRSQRSRQLLHVIWLIQNSIRMIESLNSSNCFFRWSEIRQLAAKFQSSAHELLRIAFTFLRQTWIMCFY